MIARLFLIPLVLLVLWTLYLKANGYTVKQGKQGYLYIFAVSGVLLSMMTLLLWLTNPG